MIQTPVLTVSLLWSFFYFFFWWTFLDVQKFGEWIGNEEVSQNWDSWSLWTMELWWTYQPQSISHRFFHVFCVFFSFSSFKPLLGWAGKRRPKKLRWSEDGWWQAEPFFLKGWRCWFGWFGWITARLRNSTWQWNYVSNVSIENNIYTYLLIATNYVSQLGHVSSLDASTYVFLNFVIIIFLPVCLGHFWSIFGDVLCLRLPELYLSPRLKLIQVHQVGSDYVEVETDIFSLEPPSSIQDLMFTHCFAFRCRRFFKTIFFLSQSSPWNGLKEKSDDVSNYPRF